MTTACLTMVWKDYDFLALWLRYYGGIFGRDALYVVSHGDDPRVREIAVGANLLTIPRKPPDSQFDETRWDMLSDLASGLVRYHDRVIVGDVDELIIPLDPGRDLSSVLAGQDPVPPVMAPAGYELFPEDDTPLDPTRPVLRQCWKGVLSASYSKPGILSAPARLGPGGHGSRTPFVLRSDLALLHLRYLNTPARLSRQAAREEIATRAGEESDRDRASFLRGWRKAERVRAKIGAQFAAAPEVSSADAPARAQAVLEGARKRRGGLHLFSVPKVRRQDFRLVLDPALRDRF